MDYSIKIDEFEGPLDLLLHLIKEDNIDIYNISIKNDKLKQLFQKFKENKIFYANDMCGTDFKQSIDFIIRK